MSKKTMSVILVLAVLFGGWYAYRMIRISEVPMVKGVYSGKIHVGHLVALDMAPLFLAKEAGYFKEESLDVDTTFFSNPGDNNVALTGGSLQFSVNPFTLPYLASNSGIPMRIISSAGGLGIIQVVMQGSYGISSMKDLAAFVKANKGKKLRVGALKGDTLDMILYRSFKNNGMSYDDFDLVWFNDLLAMVQSFQTNQLDILSYIQPYTTNFVVNKGAKVLTDNSEVWGLGTPNCTINVMADFLNKYPVTVKAFLKALHKGYQLEIDDPEKAVDLLSKGNYYKVEPSVLLYAFKHQPKGALLKPNVSGMMIAIADMTTQGYIQKPKDDVVDIRLLDEVLGDASTR
jgi:ABC-type nitrate/sulfonate/bicarbonate transport system substrate-binding protein